MSATRYRISSVVRTLEQIPFLGSGSSLTNTGSIPGSPRGLNPAARDPISRNALTCGLILAVMLTSAVALGEPAARSAEAADSTVIVPMADWEGRPVVGVMLNGKGPYRLLLDTGTSFPVVLDEDLLKDLGTTESSSDDENTTVEGGGLTVLKTLHAR